MSIGQVILGVQDLDVAAADCAALGLAVVDGGVHPGVGTANRLVPLGDSYLELLAVVDRGEAEGNLYGRSLLDTTAAGDRLVRWSVRSHAIEATAQRLGLEVTHRNRRRPDGSLLTWRSAGGELALELGWLPFFMQWDDDDQFPGLTPAVHPVGPCSLAWIELATPDPERLERWTDGEAGLPLRLVEGEPGLRAVAVATPDGEVVIRP